MPLPTRLEHGSSQPILNDNSTPSVATATVRVLQTSMVEWFVHIVFPQNESDDDKRKRWSSFIGIIIAISGNILISLALNVQKYAHVRLKKERLRMQAIFRRSKKRHAWRRILSHPGTADGGPSISDRTEQIGQMVEDEDLQEDLLDVAGNFVGEHSGEEEDSDNQDSQLSRSSPIDDPLSGILPASSHTPSSPGTRYLRSPWWWMGLVLMTIGECGNFLAYGFAPASIVSPLGVVALISNCIIAPVMLKEPFRTRDFLGVIVSIAGAVVVVLSSAPEEVKLGPGEILKAISRTAFEVYFAVTCTMIIALSSISRKYGSRFILIDLGLAGLYGGYTVLSTKAISSLLSSSLYRIFTMPVAYLFGSVLVATAIAQIKYVNKALQRFDSTQVIPTQFVLFTLSVITGSAILYRDFEKMNRDKMTKFIIGCMFTFSGVYLITSGRPDNEDDEDDYGLEEGDIGLVEGERGALLPEDDSLTAHPDGIHTLRRARRARILHRKSANSLRLNRASSRNSLASSIRQVLGGNELSEESPLLEHYQDEPRSPAAHTFVPNHFDSDRDIDASYSEALARHSISLIPSPFVVGNQLLAVVAEQIGTSSNSASPNKERAKWAGKRVSRKGSRSGKSLLEHKSAFTAPESFRSQPYRVGDGKSPSRASSVRSEQSSLAWSDFDEGIAAWRQRDNESEHPTAEGTRPERSNNGEAKGRARSSSVKLSLDDLKGDKKRRRESTGEGENQREDEGS